MKNLACKILRQRLIVEALTEKEITQRMLFQYLKQLTELVDMDPIGEPQVSPAKDIGIGAWQHWATSGCHVYSYDKKYTENGLNLITVDTYTCKAFNPSDVVNFTRDFFDAKEIVWKEV